jgi:hypothetical protein
MSPAKRAAEAGFAGTNLNDHVIRRETTARLHVAGDRQVLPQVAEARALAAVGDRFVHQTLARHVTADVGLKIEREAGRKQAGGDVVDGGVGYVTQAGECGRLLLRGVAVLIGIVVVVGRGGCCGACRQVASAPEPCSAAFG